MHIGNYVTKKSCFDRNQLWDIFLGKLIFIWYSSFATLALLCHWHPLCWSDFIWIKIVFILIPLASFIYGSFNEPKLKWKLTEQIFHCLASNNHKKSKTKFTWLSPAMKWQCTHYLTIHLISLETNSSKTSIFGTCSYTVILNLSN